MFPFDDVIMWRYWLMVSETELKNIDNNITKTQFVYPNHDETMFM